MICSPLHLGTCWFIVVVIGTILVVCGNVEIVTTSVVCETNSVIKID